MEGEDYVHIVCRILAWPHPLYDTKKQLCLEGGGGGGGGEFPKT